MASQHVETAVSAFLAANWSMCPVIAENTEANPPRDGSPFLLLQFTLANVERIALGKVYRESGAFRVVLNVERGRGAAKMQEWGREIAALFRGRIADGVRFVSATEPVTDDASDQGNYFVGFIVVEFWRTFRDT